ncbi:MAG: hypothetical protein QG671_358 [Actinomycetota bacterium]|nr:hypothetical protein [Actinomycetota bacterium]
MATATVEPPRIGNQSKHPWLALVSLLLGLSMIVIDGSVVNVLLPDMVRDLKLSSTDVLWVNSIYSLLFAALLIPVGLIADKYGRRKLFLLGSVIFLLGSLAAGASQSSEWLISARAVQAVGASMMLPSSIAIINVMFVGKQRAVAFGLWGAVFGGAAALGPLLGGWLTQDFSWRWAFYINVPVAIISAILVLSNVPESKIKGVDGLDPVGFVLSAAGLGLIVFGLIEGQQYGWYKAIADFHAGPIHIDEPGISVVPVAIVTGLILVGALIWWSKHQTNAGRTTMIDLSLFKIRRYGYGNVVALVVSLGEFGILFVLPLWLQSVAGRDPMSTGVILASLAFGALLSGGLARRLSSAIGATMVVRLGMVLEIVGILGIGLTFSTTRNPWWLCVPLMIYGLGLGLASAQLTNVVLSDVPPDKSGRASAMTSTFRQLGSALGAAILGAVLFTGLGTFMTEDLKGVSNLPQDQQEQIINSVRGSAGQAIVSMETIPQLAPEVAAAKEGYTTAARDTAFVAGMFVFFGLLVSLGLPKDPPGRTDTEEDKRLAAAGSPPPAGE